MSSTQQELAEGDMPDSEIQEFLETLPTDIEPLMIGLLWAVNLATCGYTFNKKTQRLDKPTLEQLRASAANTMANRVAVTETVALVLAKWNTSYNTNWPDLPPNPPPEESK